MILVHAAFALLMVFGAQAAYGITIKLSDRKVITDDDKDDSIAVQKAVNDLLAAGGGTLEFPGGVIDIRKRIDIIPTTYKPVNINFKGDGGSVIKVSVGANEIAFYCGNLNRLQIDDMVFRGMNVPPEDPRFYDAKFVIFAGWVSIVSLTNSSFLGLGVSNGGAVIEASSNLVVDKCQFDGNTAEYPDGAVINLDCCSLSGKNASISNTTFTDFTHFNGEYMSKTTILGGSWFKAKRIHYAGDPRLQRVTIEDCFFDEGAAWAINTEDIGGLNIRGTNFNVSSVTGGTAVKAVNVTRVRIEDSHFGLSTQPQPFAILSQSSGEMIGITRSAEVQCLRTDNNEAVSWRLSDCE